MENSLSRNKGEYIRVQSRRLRVEKFPNEFLVFLVESETALIEPGDDWRDFAYRVELEENLIKVNGVLVHNGSCVCTNFLMRSPKKLNAGKLFRCKHIAEARNFMMDEILSDYIRRVRVRETNIRKYYEQSKST